MTAITFPTDPDNGELYTAPNGSVYIWDGEKWVVNSTIYTGPELENITQDRVAPMFVNGNHTGITFAYDAETNTLTSTVTGGGGISITDFGEGFTDSLDDGKITTSKLYNENPNQGLNNLYVLEVTNGGVVVLPDQSIINGATLKTVPGNYAGITAGPASPAGKDEDSWVWVDNNGATIATKYSTDAHTWTFNNDGDLTLPVGGDIKDSAGNSVLGGGEGLPTVTVPAETGTDYKGLQVSYGGFHSNGDTATRNVTKVVIHKPAVTTTTITDDSDDDFFQVSGVGSSDILAMFVIIGDVNGEKPLSDITAFAEEVIDTVILFEGTEGEFRTVDQMKAAFDAAYADLVTAVGGVATNFEFFENNINVLNAGPTTVREGSGAVFTINKTTTSSIRSLGTITAGTLDQGFAVTYGFSAINNIGSGTNPALKHLYYYDVGGGIKVTRVGFEPGTYDGYTVDSNGTINSDTTTPITFTVDGVSVVLTPNEPSSPGNYDYAFEGVDPLGLIAKVGQTLAVTFGVDATGSYSAIVANGGSNYLPGHKIKILGTSLGGATPDNDAIITVESLEDTSINVINITGTPTGTAAQYPAVTGTNYNVGSGFTVAVVYKYENYVGISSYGTNYVVGDVITLLGANITGGTTPANNITITVNSIGGLGEAYGSTSSGTAPVVWRNNNISDGGEDEYDSGNYINSSYLNEIAYNGGNTVVDGAAAFGTGSSYSFVYRDSIFGLFVTGNSSTRIGTSGSGPDSGSAIISGNIYGPNIAAQTFDNAVSHINIIGDPYAGPLITFTRTDYGDEIDEISEGLHITKDDAGWLYNALEDEEHGTNTPTGSLWNNDGWDDFTNVESRTYTPLENIWGGNFANIPGAKMIMLDTTTDKYWAIEFLSWTQGQNGGGASYTRRELDLDSLETGIRFRDGTRQTTAYIADNVKLRSPGERRIEEVYGYKQVSVTSRTTSSITTTTAFSSNANDTQRVQLSASGAARDALIAFSNGDVYYRIQVSLNEDDWATGTVDGYGSNDVAIYFDDGVRLAVSQGDTVYYRSYTGGEPMIWWDKNDLPGDSSNFRGAVIKYHAYTGDSTWIGTIHIVDDDGEEHITHTEVQSGSDDGENDDLWHVTSEGRIRYRRTDGEDATLKIQWTATVFYGSEYNDD